MDAAASVNPVAQIRERIGWPQSVMANEMGLSLRAYQAIESGETPMRRIHTLAAERVLMRTAWVQSKPELARGQLLLEACELRDMLFEVNAKLTAGIAEA